MMDTSKKTTNSHLPNKVKILVIDDDHFLDNLYKKTLENAGYDVDMVRDGEQGLEKLLSSTYDIITSDIVMPKMDGLEMLKRFRDTGKRQGKIVILANIYGREEIEEAFRLGADGYESIYSLKPGDLPSLIKNYLDGSISKEESKKRALELISKDKKERNVSNSKYFYKLKTINPFIAFIIGCSVGLIVMCFYFVPKLASQEQTIQAKTELANFYKDGWDMAATEAGACQQDPGSVECNPFNKFNSKESCDRGIITTGDIVWHYKNCPAPTPQVEYKTQYVQTPTQEKAQSSKQMTSSNCTSDYSGGLYCTSNTGVQTHCTSNYAGGFYCN